MVKNLVGLGVWLVEGVGVIVNFGGLGDWLDTSFALSLGYLFAYSVLYAEQPL